MIRKPSLDRSRTGDLEAANARLEEMQDPGRHLRLVTPGPSPLSVEASRKEMDDPCLACLYSCRTWAGSVRARFQSRQRAAEPAWVRLAGVAVGVHSVRVVLWVFVRGLAGAGDPHTGHRVALAHGVGWLDTQSAAGPGVVQ